ncbi:MAG: 2-amino-4-hydroxy-6-hydroxymethyldihydropteridine diphosphokinase [Archaeoglobi archaeon]|nr:2-amino-4-hydroxy-6-hydroxymethyldihydropteridine diphosphokinase [Archaeoglobi archaeon]MDK2781707.1 2-amino-4-hydroxy-6-hydroxymethyldihydropteridine diphosphokinase [Archaeoglobi archaeon]
MIFEIWEPYYEEILRDFNFSRDKDELSAEVLSMILREMGEDSIGELRELIEGKNAVVCGKAISEEDLADLSWDVLVAADGTTSILLNLGIVPDVVVTDLDGNIEDLIRANTNGALMVIHAHGDNLGKLIKHTRKFRRIVGTTQSRPLYNVHNFGGFTDGDRCVFMTAEMGASSIIIAGFDFDDESVGETKRRKLKWAERLIFEVLPQLIRI